MVISGVVKVHPDNRAQRHLLVRQHFLSPKLRLSRILLELHQQIGKDQFHSTVMDNIFYILGAMTVLFHQIMKI